MTAYHHLLLAVDFAPSAEAVAHKASQISEQLGARLSLIHVVEFMPVDLSNELVLPQMPELEQELVQLAERRLRELADRLGIADSQRLVTRGNTRSEILRFAEEQDIDLIVLGSHGRHGIQLLLGSTANAVLHGAPCDVLAVRVTD